MKMWLAFSPLSFPNHVNVAAIDDVNGARSPSLVDTHADGAVKPAFNVESTVPVSVF